MSNANPPPVDSPCDSKTGVLSDVWKRWFNWLFGFINKAYGEIFIKTNVLPMVLTTINVFYKITTSWAADADNQNFVTPSTVNGTLTCNKSGLFFMTAMVAWHGAANDAMIVAMYKNGAIIRDHSITVRTAVLTGDNAATLTGIEPLVAGDVLDLRIADNTASGVTIYMDKVNFTIFAVG